MAVRRRCSIYFGSGLGGFRVSQPLAFVAPLGRQWAAGAALVTSILKLALLVYPRPGWRQRLREGKCSEVLLHETLAS